MMRWSGLIVVGLSMSWGCQAPNPSESLAANPNVLILMVDALRADRLGVNGYPLRVVEKVVEPGAAKYANHVVPSCSGKL